MDADDRTPAAMVARHRAARHVVCAHIVQERDRQQTLWGDQSAHLLHTWAAILAEEVGEVCQAVLQGVWRSPHEVPLQDLEAAIAEHTLLELTQTVAVAVNMLEVLLEPHEDLRARAMAVICTRRVRMDADHGPLDHLGAHTWAAKLVECMGGVCANANLMGNAPLRDLSQSHSDAVFARLEHLSAVAMYMAELIVMSKQHAPAL